MRSASGLSNNDAARGSRTLETPPTRTPDLDKLPFARTVVLMGALVALIATVIALVCTAIGFVGAALQSKGILTLEDMIGPEKVATVILLGSLIIAGVLGATINASLVRPLRRMTFAVEELACGNFNYRVEEKGRFRLREVDEFARAFNVAAAELDGTEMMRAGFISDFSHEFRTPINSLSGFAQLLRDDDLEPEERREYAGIIVEESERLAGLSERILLLSKVEAATRLPDVQEVDLAESLRRAVIVLEPKLRAKGVAVNVTLDGAWVRGNDGYLAQLWLNLLDNAVKFSPEGGHVSVALYGGRQGEEGRNGAGDEAVVWVSDEGSGMDEATKARIFDRFYQGDSSHAAAGSGLGLALCKRIVELHGGTIEVQSVPNSGSVFEVRLPLCSAPAEREATRRNTISERLEDSLSLPTKQEEAQ